MDFTLTGAAERFGVGTTVSLWQGERPPGQGGSPPGEPIATAVVASNGTLTFSGLSPNLSYIAYAASPDRYMRFFVGAVPVAPEHGRVIADEGVPLMERSRLDFIGEVVTAEDDPTNDRSIVDLTAAAPLASPAFTGVPTAPTPADTDSSDKLATTAHSWASLRARGIFNVKDPLFGAVGDGINDDTAAIQAAIAAADGDEIVVPRATYNLGSALTGTTGKVSAPGVKYAGAGASSGLYGPVVNLKDYAGDVVGGDWGPVLQDLYDTGRAIYAPIGTYDFETQIVPGDIAPRVFGDGKGRTVFRQQANIPFWSNYRNGAGVAYPKRESLSTALTADLTAGSVTASFDTTGYSAGDYVVIRSTLLWPLLDEGAVFGQRARIKSIDSGTQATLMGPLDEDYLLVDSPIIAKLDLLRGFHLEGFSIENPNPGTLGFYAKGIQANYCLRPVINDVEAITLDSAAFTFSQCEAARAVQLDSWDLTDDSANGRYGYGLYWSDGSSGVAIGCHMDGGRHSITTGSTLDEIPARHVTNAFCTATRTTNYCFHNHNSSRFIDYIVCRAYDAEATAFGVFSYDSHYKDCVAENVLLGVNVNVGADRMRWRGGEVTRVKKVGIGAATGMNIDAADCVVNDVDISDTDGVGIIANTNGLRTNLRDIRLARTELQSATKRGISIAADGCSLTDIFGDTMNYVVDYNFAGATNIRERNVRGINITTNLRRVGSGTFVTFEGKGTNGDIETQSGSGSVTLAPGTAADTILFTAPITADRTANFSHTNAVKGEKHRVVRTAASTGAFNRNVQSNGVTIKALTAGTWVDIEFDGTSFQVIGSGTL